MLEILTLTRPKGGTFRVMVKKVKKQTAAYIFTNRDKQPMCGTIFSEKENPSAITTWAEKQILNYPQSDTR